MSAMTPLPVVMNAATAAAQHSTAWQMPSQDAACQHASWWTAQLHSISAHNICMHDRAPSANPDSPHCSGLPQAASWGRPTWGPCLAVCVCSHLLLPAAP
jgi:hypothetical protein